MSRRRSIKLDEENTDRWMVSYADFVTLLFAFFVVMYSVSSVNLGKYRVLSDSVTSAFNKQGSNIINPGDKLGISVQRAPISLGLKNQVGQRALRNTAAAIEKEMKPWIKKGEIAVRGNQKWLEVEINSSILFTTGSADLSPAAQKILTDLSDVFKGSPNPLYVSGYTDDLPINTLQFPSNWELSAARAASVVRLFSKAGIKPARMGAIGFSQYRPVSDNRTAADRQKNRRVIIRMLAGDDMFSDTTPFGAQPETSNPESTTSPAPATTVTRLQEAEPARGLE